MSPLWFLAPEVRALVDANSRLAALLQVTQILGGHASLGEILEFAFAPLREVLHAQKLTLVLCDEGGRRLEYGASSGLTPEEERFAMDGIRDPEPDNPFMIAKDLDVPLLVPDAAAPQVPPRARRFMEISGMGSVAFVPLNWQGERLGVLALGFEEPRAFDRGDMEFLESVGTQLAMRIKVGRQQEEQARQLERLKEADRIKGSFLSAASHELRTPLSSIRGYAEFLEDELAGPLTEQQRAFVQEIGVGADRLRRIVDDILDYARLEAGSFGLQVHECDLNVVVAGVLSSLRPQFRAGRIKVQRTIPRTPVHITIDPHRIGQVVLNLVGNAVKFTPPGGKIRVAVRPFRDAVMIEVADTGIGIDTRHLPRLFDRFYQADSSLTRARGGAGLGLAIAKGLIEAHGGEIGVESVLGSGSKFWFTVPRVNQLSFLTSSLEPTEP